MTDFKQTGDTYQGFIKNDLTQMAKGIQTAKYCRDVQGRCYRIVGLLLGSCPEVQSSGSLAQNPSLNYIINDNGKTQCPINTTDLGAIKSGYKGNPIVRLCRLSSIKGAGEDAKGNKNNLGAVVNAVVAEKFQTLGEKANLGGFPLSANSSFRLENSCGGKGDGDYCANPGTSPHQLGIAVDLAGTGGIKGNTFTCSKKAVGTTKL